ncbi:MAG: L,D-transpeptidase family protein [Caulobacteraceae bacterium]
MRKARALGLAGGLAVFALAWAASASQPLVQAVVPPSQAARPQPRRIWYQGAKTPQLVFPDGSRRSVRSLLNVSHAMTYGDYVWDEDGVPAGPLWVRVDIRAQLISVFRGDHEIGTAVVLYGAQGKPTPIGAFHILQKAKDYQSHTYDAPMPFMLRLTSDGVAIHASNVREGWATHGCIGVPMDFAKRLFGEARLGDTVLITSAAKS